MMAVLQPTVASMKVEEIAPDVWMFVGRELESVATAFVDGDDALLVDTLGGVDDAHALRRVLRDQMGKRVRIVVSTHFMSDHIAGLSLFPEATTIAHRHHRHAFLSQNRQVDAFYLEPQVVFDSAMRIRWGRHALHLLHNPGKTMDHLSVDVPSADLVCAGDNIVGNIVYVSRADPAQIRSAIVRMQQLGRRRVIGGHMGMFGAATLGNAVHYLDRLADAVVGIRTAVDSHEADARIASIAIEPCLAAGVEPSPFERHWHERNLEAIVTQSMFTLDAALAARRAHA